MTDDRKPRHFYIADDYDNGLHVEDKPTEGFDIKVIELEPTLQLMKEMGDKLESANSWIRTHAMQTYSRVASREAEENEVLLEKYRKFLEGIEK